MKQVQWRDWDESTFEEARRLERPILLSITASWCSWCHQMDRLVFGDDEIRSLVEEHYIPIRADKDKRPDLNERYNQGGWPTTVFLTPDGELLRGGTFFTKDELRPLLKRVHRYYQDNREEVHQHIATLVERTERFLQNKDSRRGELRPTMVDDVLESMLEKFDAEYGGFGTGQKFPHPESIDFALMQYHRTNDQRIHQVITLTLTRMSENGLCDQEEGGFFRYAARRDWREPHHEKMLETNAGLLKNYIAAYACLGTERFRDTAQQIVGYLNRTLLSSEGFGFYGSQDDESSYYSLALADRREKTPPRVDRTIYTNWNAQTASAYLRAGLALEQPELSDIAVRTVDFLIDRLYLSGKGMYHYFDGSARILGLLTDQFWMAKTLIDTASHTGDNQYLEVARDIVEVMIDKQKSEHGGFYDIQRDPAAQGGLRRQNKSILQNAVIGELLTRLAYLTGEERYREIAGETLRSFARDYKQYGYFTSGYARAVDIFLHPPVYIQIVGSLQDPALQALHQHASKIYLPAKIVQVLDPERDRDVIGRFHLEDEASPCAFVSSGRTSHGRAHTVDELAALIEQHQHDRYSRTGG